MTEIHKSQTILTLEKILAASYSLMLKTQNYHWNVEGENFKSLHDLFGEQYEEIFAAIDEIAERIRSLDSKVEGSFLAFSKNSKSMNFKAGNKNFSAKEMISDLVADNRNLAQSLHAAIKVAQNEGDEVSADLLIERSSIHEKAAWMLSASK